MFLKVYITAKDNAASRSVPNYVSLSSFRIARHDARRGFAIPFLETGTWKDIPVEASKCRKIMQMRGMANPESLRSMVRRQGMRYYKIANVESRGTGLSQNIWIALPFMNHCS